MKYLKFKKYYGINGSERKDSTYHFYLSQDPEVD